MRAIMWFSALFLLTATPALAVDWSQPVTDETGKPMQDADKKDITLGKVAARALFNAPPEVGPGGQPVKTDDQEKFKRGMLGTKLYQGGEIDLSVEEIAIVKSAINKAYPPFVVYQTWKMIDPSLADHPAPKVEEAKPK